MEKNQIVSRIDDEGGFMPFSTREPSQTAFTASSFKGALKVLCYEEKDIFHLLSCGIQVLCKGKFRAILPGDTFFSLSVLHSYSFGITSKALRYQQRQSRLNG